MQPHAPSTFPSPGSSHYDLVLVTQSLLKREIAAALLTGSGDPRLVAALAEIRAALTPDVARALSPVISKTDLAPSDRVLGTAARLVTDRGIVAADDGGRRQTTPSDRPRAEGRGGVPDPGPGQPRDGGSPPGRGGDVVRDGGRDRAGSPRYHLTVYLTKVVAVRLTPGMTDDEFRLTGGYTYHNALMSTDGVASDKTQSMTAWEHDFGNNGETADDTDEHVPHMLLSEAVPPGDTHLMMTVTPTEEDVLSTEAARAIGRFASVLMTMGIDLLAGMAIAAGHSVAPGAAALTPEAQQLIRDHAVPGIVGAIQQALGPELFKMPLMRVDTNWTPGAPVQWSSWGWYAHKPTTPATGAGAGTRNATDIRIDQIRIEADANNVLRETVVAGGGTYTLDVQFVMMEI